MLQRFKNSLNKVEREYLAILKIAQYAVHYPLHTPQFAALKFNCKILYDTNLTYESSALTPTQPHQRYFAFEWVHNSL